ncbi:GNAT family N-acetyltransferase [Nocardia sp. NPDC049149]|uniref:GNAT family N-acetyltransferase n=1 Tax=Nocardia sp. NPDC049149 TaxID=3364315 RepID=UPI00371ECCE8
MIQEAGTDEMRQDVLDFFLINFHDIDPNAVPMTALDGMYAPLVVQFRDDVTGRLLGAALSCRAQVAAGSTFMKARGVPLESEADYSGVLDRHSELDLMSVAPEARGQGIGSQMLMYMEEKLCRRGVRVWFGNATADLQTDRLRGFYTSHGFTVLGQGEPLPPFFGKRWISPNAVPPAFYFYKKLASREER